MVIKPLFPRDRGVWHVTTVLLAPYSKLLCTPWISLDSSPFSREGRCQRRYEIVGISCNFCAYIPIAHHCGHVPIELLCWSQKKIAGWGNSSSNVTVMITCHSCTIFLGDSPWKLTLCKVCGDKIKNDDKAFLPECVWSFCTSSGS